MRSSRKSAEGDPKFYKRVAIVYRHIPQYRLEFYEGLRASLAQEGVWLDVFYGDPIGEDQYKNDAVDLPWGAKVRNRVVNIGRKNVCYQAAFTATRGYDLVVVEHASRLLLNYLLLAGSHFGGPKVAIWGHGRNLQADGSPLSKAAELAKRLPLWPHWVFAYTAGSARIYQQDGYKASRITVVQNAIDTSKLAVKAAGITTDDVEAFAEKHDLNPGWTGLFVGALYEEKQLPFLIAAARIVASREPRFRLLVAGDGPARAEVEEASRASHWLKYIGPVFGSEKALAFKSAEFLLMPGLVGLVVLDAFTLATPMISTTYPRHSPEIEYLENGSNGLLSPFSTESYAETVLAAFSDASLGDSLRVGCVESSSKYGITQMVANFAHGVRQALEAA